jgi:hypothetical protein
MIIVYCFIGPLPSYAVDTVHQTRLFYKGPIYFIMSDLQSPHRATLESYGVEFISYDGLKDETFYDCIKEHYTKFSVVEGLKGRENLFVYAFERFFVLYHVMKQREWTDVLFLELDNLIYDDPLKWEETFSSQPMAFMYDNVKRCASGICYIQSHDILFEFTQCCLEYIRETDIANDFMTEMQALYAFWKKNPEKVQLLPIHWPSENVPPETYENYHRYRKSIFDAAAIGVYLGGVDPYHTHGLVITGLRCIWSIIDYTHYQYDWREDEEGRLIPYILNKDKWIRINNLHIHSKNLKPYLSK